MPAARTPAQAEAARQNGAKSRGPLTPEGKARSSRNALQHGLRASKHLLLPGENADDFQALLADLIDDLTPATTLEAELVTDLAETLWKRRRSSRLEQALFVWTTDPMAPEATFAIDRFSALRRAHAALGRDVDRLLAQLRRLRGEREQREAAGVPNEPEPVPPDQPNEPKTTAPLPPNEPGDAPALAPIPSNAPNEPGRTFSPADRAEIEAMISGGGPELLIAAARRAGILHRVMPRLEASLQRAAGGEPPLPA